jgi:hypothetical protein
VQKKPVELVERQIDVMRAASGAAEMQEIRKEPRRQPAKWVDKDIRLAVKALIECLSDSDDTVRKEAIEALGEIGPVAKDALPTLKGLAEDKDFNIAIRAKRALKEIEAQK